jgi:hypothetical protein
MHTMKRSVQTLILLVVVGALAMGTQLPARATITDDINPQLLFVGGNTVSVMLTNGGKGSAGGTVVAETTVDGVVYSASTKVYLDAGQSVTVDLVLDAAVEDPDPMGIALTIVDDINPQGR